MGCSYRLSDTSELLTEALRYHRVVHRDSEIPQGSLQRLLDTSGWLTEALRTLRVVHRGSHILYIGSQKL